MMAMTRRIGLAMALGFVAGCAPQPPPPTHAQAQVDQPTTEELATDDPAQPWDRPIPQDYPRSFQRRIDSYAFYRRTLDEAYDRVGQRDPKWDEAAKRALERAATSWHMSYVEFPRGDDSARQLLWIAIVACREALAAGCDDPLIRVVEALSAYDFNEPNSTENIHRLLPAVAALERSDYPAIRKVWALSAAAAAAALSEAATPEERQGADQTIDLLLKWLAISARADERDVDANFYRESALRLLIQTRRALTNDVEETLAWITAQVQPTPELEVNWLQARCTFLRSYAWEARGNGYADTVTEEGNRLMQERLDDARRSIERAWTLRPGDALTACCGLDTTIGGSGDRAEMEEWFRRAMTADGDCWRACQSKLYWLEPKWYGSPEEVIAFGRQCGATNNSIAGLTTFEPEAYLLADSGPDNPPGGDFWRSPEVWNRSRSIFDEYLKTRPYDYIQLTRYAIIAALTGHHADATRLFDQVGDKIHLMRSHGITLDWVKSLRDNTPPPGVKPAPR